MIEKSIKNFINEIYSKPPRKNYSSNKTDVFCIDILWSLDTSDLKDCGAENNRGYRYRLVIKDNFSKIGWTTTLKNTKLSNKKDSFAKILINSNRKPNLIKTDRGKKFYDNIFQNFLNNNNTKLFSRTTSFGSFFAERFNRTIRDLL